MSSAVRETVEIGFRVTRETCNACPRATLRSAEPRCVFREQVPVDVDVFALAVGHLFTRLGVDVRDAVVEILDDVGGCVGRSAHIRLELRRRGALESLRVGVVVRDVEALALEHHELHLAGELRGAAVGVGTHGTRLEHRHQADPGAGTTSPVLADAQGTVATGVQSALEGAVLRAGNGFEEVGASTEDGAALEVAALVAPVADAVTVDAVATDRQRELGVRDEHPALTLVADVESGPETAPARHHGRDARDRGSDAEGAVGTHDTAGTVALEPGDALRHMSELPFEHGHIDLQSRDQRLDVLDVVRVGLHHHGQVTDDSVQVGKRSLELPDPAPQFAVVVGVLDQRLFDGPLARACAAPGVDDESTLDGLVVDRDVVGEGRRRILRQRVRRVHESREGREGHDGQVEVPHFQGLLGRGERRWPRQMSWRSQRHRISTNEEGHLYDTKPLRAPKAL